MRRLLCVILFICILVSLTACGGKPQEETAAGFKPSLDTGTSCSITVVGSYDNFEALEAEFDKFNEIYPNVQLSYVKLDDYNNVLGATLESNDKPNVFFSYTWMMGNEKYASVCAHMEELSDSALGLNLDCIRPGLLNHDAEGHVFMVPVFSRTYGMLVNNDLFEKEGLSVPTTRAELMAVCEEFKNKGYASPMMGYSLKSNTSTFMNTVAYPLFVATLAENPEALKLANALDPAAGEYMRPALEAVGQLIQSGCINLTECDKIEDNYTKVILRFFEGDVPMMICPADTVSGTKKRESQSEADLEMTNEFMRFLVTNKALNEMASVKRLVTPTTDLSFDSVYAPFGQVPSDRILSPEALGIKDPLAVQIRVAAFQVGKGEITIDEAVAMYGSFS